jgi:hypothetical protein
VEEPTEEEAVVEDSEQEHSDKEDESDEDGQQLDLETIDVDYIDLSLLIKGKADHEYLESLTELEKNFKHSCIIGWGGGDGGRD